MRLHMLAVPCVALALFALSTDSDAALSGRNYSAGNFVVEIGGQSGGFVSKVAGGGVSSPVMVEKSGGPGSYPKKRIGPTQYDDVVFSVGTPERPLMDWIKAAVNSAQAVKKDGAIVVGDMSFKEVSRLTWKGGYLSEVTFPELDGAQGKKRWEMELTVTADSTSHVASSGGAVVSAGISSKSKAGLTSNFRLTIPGIDTRRVLKIEEISVRFRTVTAPIGELKSFEKTPGAVDISNLVFEMPEGTDAAQLYGWYQGFVKGGGADKKTATIELFSADMKTVLCKLALNGVGIAKVGPTAPAQAGADAQRRVRAEAFVESVQFDYNSER